MKSVYVIYEHPYANKNIPIALVSSKKKAIEYCSTEGRKPIGRNYENMFGTGGKSGYYFNVLSFQKMEVL